VAEKPSDVRECARAGPWRRAERADLTGLAHGAEREDKGVRATARRLAIQVRETERESAGAKENWRRQVGPTEQRAREREREREWALRVAPTGGARLSGREGARACTRAGLLGCLGPK
jgi:hypothetical protein